MIWFPLLKVLHFFYGFQLRITTYILKTWFNEKKNLTCGSGMTKLSNTGIILHLELSAHATSLWIQSRCSSSPLHLSTKGEKQINIWSGYLLDPLLAGFNISFHEIFVVFIIFVTKISWIKIANIGSFSSI